MWPPLSKIHLTSQYSIGLSLLYFHDGGFFQQTVIEHPLYANMVERASETA